MKKPPIRSKANITMLGGAPSTTVELLLIIGCVIVITIIFVLLVYLIYEVNTYQYFIKVNGNRYRCNSYQETDNEFILNDCVEGDKIIIKYPKNVVIIK